MMSRDLLGDDFTAAVRAAGARAREETLKAGVPVFYRDSALGVEIMEQPDGRRFEIAMCLVYRGSETTKCCVNSAQAPRSPWPS